MRGYTEEEVQILMNLERALELVSQAAAGIEKAKFLVAEARVTFGAGGLSGKLNETLLTAEEEIREMAQAGDEAVDSVLEAVNVMDGRRGC